MGALTGMTAKNKVPKVKDENDEQLNERVMSKLLQILGHTGVGAIGGAGLGAALDNVRRSRVQYML